MMPLRPAALALVGMFSAAALAQDPAPGKVLYETHCGGCHYERVHQRAKPAVKDMAQLRDAVARWSKQTKRTYTLEELESIAQYLNTSHYRFRSP